MKLPLACLALLTLTACSSTPIKLVEYSHLSKDAKNRLADRMARRCYYAQMKNLLREPTGEEIGRCMAGLPGRVIPLPTGGPDDPTPEELLAHAACIKDNQFKQRPDGTIDTSHCTIKPHHFTELLRKAGK